MPGNDYATKQDLAELRSHTDARFGQIDARLDGIDHRIEHMEHRLIEQMRDMQTEVLRAFHEWARPTEIKLRSIVGFEERLGLLEERVSRIERGDKPH